MTVEYFKKPNSEILSKIGYPIQRYDFCHGFDQIIVLPSSDGNCTMSWQHYSPLELYIKFPNFQYFYKIHKLSLYVICRYVRGKMILHVFWRNGINCFQSDVPEKWNFLYIYVQFHWRGVHPWHSVVANLRGQYKNSIRFNWYFWKSYLLNKQGGSRTTSVAWSRNF